MENSGYLALARQVALDRAIDVTANNLANLRTSGYKAEKVMFEEYVQKGTSPATAPNQMSSVVQLGTFTDYQPGSFEQTGNALDFAIQGEGFFPVQTDAGTRYTRDGSFELDANGQLVTHDGNPVTDAGGSPIQLPAGAKNIIVGGDGQVSVDGNVVGQDAQSPYSIQFNSAIVSNANHTFAAKAWDAAGNFMVSSSVTATVQGASRLGFEEMEKRGLVIPRLPAP